MCRWKCYSIALLMLLLLNDGHNVFVYWHSHATLLMSTTTTGAVFRFVLASTHYLRTLLNRYYVNVLTLILKNYTQKITLYSFYKSSWMFFAQHCEYQLTTHTIMKYILLDIYPEQNIYFHNFFLFLRSQKNNKHFLSAISLESKSFCLTFPP